MEKRISHGLDDFVLATQVDGIPFGVELLASGEPGAELGSRHVQIQAGIDGGGDGGHRERAARRRRSYGGLLCLSLH